MTISRKKTVFIFVNLQYSAKYILQTNLIEDFKKHYDQVVIISPNATDRKFIKSYQDQNIFFEKSNYRVSDHFKSRRINRLFSNIRRFVYPSGSDFGTLNLKEKFLNIKRMSLKKRSYYSFILLISKLMRKSSMLRSFVFKLETLFYPLEMHREIYKKYEPSLVVFQDLGTIERTNYQIYEAKKLNIQTAVLVLSWDNLTAKGMGCIKPDYFSVWNEDLRDELIQNHDIEEHRISVDGNPIFDDHFNIDKTSKSLKENDNEKIVFFATGSPGWFKDIAKSLEVLLKANERGLFNNKIKFIVRLHPIFLMKSNNNELVRSEIKALNDLSEVYGDSIHLFYPSLVRMKYGFEFEKKDIINCIEALRDCDILLTNFSTMMLEACIFDKPIVNIGYDFIRKSEQRSHEACMNESHLRNIFTYEFASVAKTQQEAIDQINSYIKDPSIHTKGRQIVKKKYCGVNAGQASEAIVKNMYDNIMY